jgi:hypothetical protein
MEQSSIVQEKYRKRTAVNKARQKERVASVLAENVKTDCFY